MSLEGCDLGEMKELSTEMEKTAGLMTVVARELTLPGDASALL